MTPDSPPLLLGAALACGLMIGIERGWRLRDEAIGTRVAGIRTFTLLGVGGGVSGLLGPLLSPIVTAVLASALVAVIVIGFVRDSRRRDATSFVAAIVALALGLLAGAGEASLAVASAAVVTLVLATRTASHAIIRRLNRNDVRAFARYAVIAAAVLPFLPNRTLGPLHAWNPFQLWLVVILVTGFSFAGYVASRIFGSQKGVLATAIIGGAYSSTAVTASLSQRLGKGASGPLGAGIAIASAMMYLRVTLLVAVLSPSTLPAFAVTTGPALLVALVSALAVWKIPGAPGRQDGKAPGNPIELLPALFFAAIVAVAAIATRWAQLRFGESGISMSLFLTGSFDVDAAVVTLSSLGVGAINRELAAIALGSAIVANMGLKMIIVAIYARRRGAAAIIALAASTATFVIALLWRANSLGLFQAR